MSLVCSDKEDTMVSKTGYRLRSGKDYNSKADVLLIIGGKV
jgi:hypothetical protein